MKISELGEFGLIDLVAGITEMTRDSGTNWRDLLIGVGDDTAVWKGNLDLQLATTDTLVEDVHFRLNEITWEELGWKSMAINLSDIAAMGGSPTYALVSLALPGHLETTCIADLYKGMTEIAGRWGVAVAGGNVAGSESVVITLTLMGRLEANYSPLRRDNAVAGYQIAVTGYPGTSAAGLEMLTRRLIVDKNTAAVLRQAHFRPVPRIEEGRKLVGMGIRTAIDISDGIIGDLQHICQRSSVGAVIYTDRLPVRSEVKSLFNDNWQKLALTGGEDYELMFMATRSLIEAAKGEMACPVTTIGEITAEHPGAVTLFDETGKALSLDGCGWEHFKSVPRHD